MEQEEPFVIRKRKGLQEMREVITTLGPSCVNRAYFARKYKVSWPAAERWFEALLHEIPLESMESVKKCSHRALSRSLDICQQILLNPATSPGVKLKAIETLNNTIKTNTEFLEKFNMKPVVAQELNMAVNATLDVERILKIAQDSKTTFISTGESALPPGETLEITDTSTPKKDTGRIVEVP